MLTAGQAPLPSQLAGKVWVPPAQLSCRQPALLDEGRQAPEPLQVPSFEQSPVLASLFTQRDFGSEPPLSTLEHVPTRLVPVPLQVVHRPPEAASAQAELQQAPSVQNPLWHWPAEVHAAPFTFNPQELCTQVSGAAQSVSWVQVVLQAPEAQTKLPHDWLAEVHAAPLTFNPQELFTQVSGATQSVSLVQVVLQAPEAQTKLPHDWLAEVEQAPRPSQVEAGVTEDVPAQAAAWHWEPLA